MAFDSLNITFTDEDAARIPDLFLRGGLSLLTLTRGGALSTLADTVRIRRSGGFCGLDVWLTLWMYFAAVSSMGIKRFWRLLRPHSEQIAALAGRKKLVSPPSLSRALCAVEFVLLRPVADSLLLAPAECDQVLRHPAVRTYDTLGDGWHCFDFDPTVTTLRHRALPVGDDLPAPRRTSEDTGVPGYKGRKRGDIVFRRATVQHSGSGLWTHGHQVPMDGDHGNVPWFAACRERGIPFVTRLNRMKLLDDPEVLGRLRTALFHLVEDSGCGPQRSAADLGVLTLSASHKTRRPDGSKYEPIELRVVACIFPKTGKAKRGRTIDGWEVELFAVDLPADRWPAPEATTAYYGRNAEENRFAQEDRELGLDRIVSYHLPGQELATLVGLSLWNHDVVQGFELNTPPATALVQHLRQQRLTSGSQHCGPASPSSPSCSGSSTGARYRLARAGSRRSHAPSSARSRGSPDPRRYATRCSFPHGLGMRTERCSPGQRSTSRSRFRPRKLGSSRSSPKTQPTASAGGRPGRRTSPAMPSTTARASRSRSPAGILSERSSMQADQQYPVLEARSDGSGSSCASPMRGWPEPT